MSEKAVIELTAGNLVLELSPGIGGSISAFERVEDGLRRPILRKCHSAVEKVLDAACFPLAPFANRVRGGRFRFRGREVALMPNMAGDPSPLHGQGWLKPWTVQSADDDAAVLLFQHSAGEWPWDYEARQEFALDEHGLTATLTCRNASHEPMPCGLGFHPYFHCGPATRLDTQVATAWTIDDKVLPVDKVPAVDRYDLRDRLVCGQGLDNGFGDWGGAARMRDPDWQFEIDMSSQDAKFFQLYSPPDGGIFVAEPVTHANAALNAPEEQWPELGLRVLEADEEMRLVMRLEVQPAEATAG